MYNCTQVELLIYYKYSFCEKLHIFTHKCASWRIALALFTVEITHNHIVPNSGRVVNYPIDLHFCCRGKSVSLLSYRLTLLLNFMIYNKGKIHQNLFEVQLDF